MLAKIIHLNASLTIPVVGFGTWELTKLICSDAVATASQVGYRYIRPQFAPFSD